MDNEVQDLITERGKSYGRTWLHAGVVMGLLREPFYHLLQVAPWVAHNWVLILSKMIRILYTPWERDHWADIMGYVQLVLNEMDQRPEEEQDNDVSSK